MTRWRWKLAYVYLDPVIGSEQAGNRPILVVSDETFNELMDVVTVLPLTRRKPERNVYYNEVLLPESESGLPYESIIMAHQIRTISKTRIKRAIGYIANSEIQAACIRAMQIHLGMY
ncbi:MAG: type II toxin-antitoxin system PemK/MazF family toxin [Spirochaeta sp.]|jgi:mRNA interferase MazF|nr:type II toxin-antitoxin system PemK/MazF family toxin [Spirochaeta sp.]